MKKLFTLLIISRLGLVSAQNLQINISNSESYSVPDQILGVNTEGSFAYRNSNWKRFLDINNNYNTFVTGFTGAVTNLGFKSFYFPGGSLARLYHYSPTGHGYCFNHNEAIKMDSAFNNLHNLWGTADESHVNEIQYQWENNTSYNGTHPLPPPYIEKHRDLCQLNASSTVVSVNVIWSNPAELKTILDAFLNGGVNVSAVVMGTEVDNNIDAIFFPNSASSYNDKIDPFLDMLRNPENSLYESRFASISIAVNTAGETGSNFTSWNTSVSNHMDSAYGLPKVGAINWWWYPRDCTNPMTDPKTCMDDYFYNLPARINGFKAFYDQMYVVQYGVKPFDSLFDYKNTFISGFFPMKKLFWMVDYNAVNGEFFKGAFFMRLASATSYDLILDDNKTSTVETNHTTAYDAFLLAKEVTGKKYLHTEFTSMNGRPVHAEPYFFYDTLANSGKLYILNSSGSRDTLNKIYFDCSRATGLITIRTISANGLLTTKNNIPPLVTTTQTSSTGQYTIEVPGYSMLVVDFTIPTSQVTSSATPSSICEGDSSILSASGAAGYTWGPATGLSATTGSSVTATPQSTIAYTMTGTDSSGCSVMRTLPVTVTPLPIPSITGNNSICSGTSTTFDAGGGFTSYSWSTGATTQTISVDAGGTYIVTVSNASGCTASATKSLTVNSTPAPTIRGLESICSGQSTTYDTDTGFTAFLWSTGETTQTISVNAAETYIVTVTNSSGCTGSATKALIVNSNPTPAISGSVSICSGQSATYDAGEAFTSYSWSTGATTQTLSVNTAGTYIVTVTNNNGCIGSAAKALTVDSNPAPSISGVESICSGQSATYDADTGFIAYSWSTGATTQTISVNTAGTYTVIVSNAAGCTASAAKSLTVNSNPTPAISGSSIICSGQSETFDAGTGFTSYSWSTGATAQTISVNTAGTYTVTVTNSNSCSGSASKSLTVNSNPTTTISGLANICSGQSTTYDAGAGFTSYNWSTGATTQTISVSSADTYTATVTNSNGCSGSASKSLTVNSNPTPTISGVASICSGQSTTYDAGAGVTSYSWSTGATTQTISVSSADTYTATVTNSNGCSGSASKSLTVNSNPTPTISGVASICSGQSTTYDAGAGFTSYSWSTGATTQTISVSSADTYTATVTNSNGCSGSASKSLIVNSNPTPTISGAASICSGQSTTYDAGAGFTSYSWSTGATTQAISINTAGTYTVTVTNSNGCTGSASKSLTINSNPIPTISGAASICSGQSTNYDAGTGFTTYSWSTGASTQTISVTEAGTYSVTVTNSSGCTGSASKSLTINSNPTPTISGAASICSGQSTNYDAGAGFASYNWSTGATTQTISVNTGGTYTVTITNSNGCTGSASKSLTVNSNPIPTISGAASICSGQSTTYDASAGFASYNWSTGATTQTISVNTGGTYTVTVTNSSGCTGSGSKSLTVNSNPTPTISGAASICSGQSTNYDAGTGFTSYSWSTGASTQTISVNAAGTYTVTVTNSGGCSGSASKSLTVNSNPTTTISGSASICSGKSTTYNGGAGFSAYSWSTGATTQTISVNTAGTYTVTVTNSSGCTGSASKSLTVNSSPAPTITGSATICSGQSTTYDAGAGFTSYSWSTGATTQTISVNTAGTYTATVTNSSGCSGSASKTLTVSSNPTPAITGAANKCAGQSATYDAGAGYIAYLWSTGATTQAISVSTAGSYTVTVTNSNGCTGTASKTLTITAAPTVTISPSAPSICPGNSIALTASGANTYKWSPSTGLNSTSGATVTANPTATTTYTVTGTNSSGCTGKSPVTVTVSCPVPTNLSTTGITKNSAITNWTTVSCATGYKVNYKKTSGGGWTEHLITSNIGNHSLTGLKPNTSYDWKVATKCPNGNYSAFSTTITFTTPLTRMLDDVNGEFANDIFSIVPNPNDGQMTIQLQTSENISGTAGIIVMNMLGQTILTDFASVTDGAMNKEITLPEGTGQGIYLVKVIVNDKVYVGRIICGK